MWHAGNQIGCTRTSRHRTWHYVTPKWNTFILDADFGTHNIPQILHTVPFFPYLHLRSKNNKFQNRTKRVLNHDRNKF